MGDVANRTVAECAITSHITNWLWDVEYHTQTSTSTTRSPFNVPMFNFQLHCYGFQSFNCHHRISINSLQSIKNNTIKKINF